MPQCAHALLPCGIVFPHLEQNISADLLFLPLSGRRFFRGAPLRWKVYGRVCVFIRMPLSSIETIIPFSDIVTVFFRSVKCPWRGHCGAAPKSLIWPTAVRPDLRNLLLYLRQGDAVPLEPLPKGCNPFGIPYWENGFGEGIKAWCYRNTGTLGKYRIR